MGTTGRSGGVNNPSGSKSKNPMMKPTSMKRATGMGRGGMMKHNVSKGMKSIKHARLSKPKGRISNWGSTKRVSTLMWTARTKK
jgi:hypothetical protein